MSLTTAISRMTRRIPAEAVPRLQLVPLVGAIVALVAGSTLSLIILNQLQGLHLEKQLDLWFEADVFRVFENLTSRFSDHYRTAVHPLSSLILSTPAIAMIKLGFSPNRIAHLATAAGAGLLSASMFILLYRLHGVALNAAVFTGLFLSSAGFLFFSGIVELYAWGGLSIVVAILLSTTTGPLQPLSLVAAGAISLSITVTNWMAGIAGALVREKWPRALLYSALALAAVAALSAVQTLIYPTAGRFLSIREEQTYTTLDIAKRASEVPRAFFLTSIVHDRLSPSVDRVGNPIITAQQGIQSLGIAGYTACALWLVLLIGGMYGAAKHMRSADLAQRTLARLTPLLVLGQFVLHFIYGEETILYSLHYVPLLVLLASFFALTAWRWLALSLATALAVLAFWHNIHQFERARTLADSLLLKAELTPHTQRDQLLAAIRARPSDFWPRGIGHVPIGLPGAPETDKGWIEPGGSFSPAERSFGLSVWIRGDGGIQTSDTLPMADIRQSFVGNSITEGVGVRAETAAYVVEWRQKKIGEWNLRLTPKMPTLELALRSVGPAGGPINSLRVDGNTLVVNERWRLISHDGLTLIDTGEETDSNWIDRRTVRLEANYANGWGGARYAISGPASLTVLDTQIVPSYSLLQKLPVHPGVTIEGGSAEFNEALNAQVAQLMMGSVGEEARPGDPLHYPLAWQRDAAYVVGSLARSGRLDAARLLVTDIAERDFFGGFGAEADAPGLALWAIGVVSRGLDDPAFDQIMYPHVYRKAELIRSFLSADKDIYRDYSGPVVPDHAGHHELRLVANPAVDGLIVGRMDWHRPRMFITAVSIRGLEEAIRLARRAADEPNAERWDQARAALQDAYTRALERGMELDNDRTLISAFYPMTASRGSQVLKGAFERDWAAARTPAGDFTQRPLWTYFELAKARQWLRLERPDRTWQTLEYFWKQSPAPGLFTQWESDKEEHSFDRWVRSRGWANPRHVTPHYWSAAEMILTQAAMLAYVDNDTLVIGAGVPQSWLSKPLRVTGLITDAGPVSWSWDGRGLHVRTCNATVKVRGAHELSETPITVDRC